MDTQTQFLKPEEIAQKFDITEHEVWRKLESGEWQAQTLCEQTGIEGGHLPFDRACINAEVVRLLIGKPGQEVEFTTRYGHRRKASAGKENIEVLVGPEFTPELFPENTTCSTANTPTNAAETPAERQERIKKRHMELKAAGCDSPTKTIAEEEGVDASRIRQILRVANTRPKGVLSAALQQIRKH